VIANAEPIARAHPRFVENLRALGADVTWEEAA
jgi:UDP-N-acetylglucosamine 1-carboxyvinyltransferase